MNLVGRKSTGSGVDQKAAHGVLAILAAFGPDQCDVGQVAVGDPHLAAVEHVAVAVAHGARLHAGRVGAVLVLREAEAADDLAAVHARADSAPSARPSRTPRSETSPGCPAPRRSCASPNRRARAPGRSAHSWCSRGPSHSAGWSAPARRARRAAESAHAESGRPRTRPGSAAAPHARRTRGRRPGSSPARATAPSRGSSTFQCCCMPDFSCELAQSGACAVYSLLLEWLRSQPARAPDSGAEGCMARRRGSRAPVRSTGRLVWHIGDWGRASEHIGARWEVVAGELAHARLAPDDHLIILAATPKLMSEVLGSGLPHADALRAWREDSTVALEPLDFKWSLETASSRQVSSETLDAPAGGRPARAEGGPVADTGLSLGWTRPRSWRPGTAASSRRSTLPITPRCWPSPSCRRCCCRSTRTPSSSHCPAGRPRGRWHASRPRTWIALSSIEAIERYYRLGAGVEGALSRWKRASSRPSRARWTPKR